jgi:hypothetical protein
MSSSCNKYVRFRKVKSTCLWPWTCSELELRLKFSSLNSICFMLWDCPCHSQSLSLSCAEVQQQLDRTEKQEARVSQESAMLETAKQWQQDMTWMLADPSNSPKVLAVHKRWKDVRERNTQDMLTGALFFSCLGGADESPQGGSQVTVVSARHFQPFLMGKTWHCTWDDGGRANEASLWIFPELRFLGSFSCMLQL